MQIGEKSSNVNGESEVAFSVGVVYTRQRPRNVNLILSHSLVLDGLITSAQQGQGKKKRETKDIEEKTKRRAARGEGKKAGEGKVDLVHC